MAASVAGIAGGGVLGFTAEVEATGTACAGAELPLPLKCDQAKKAAAARITAAAIPMKIFLFPPLDSDSVVEPPKENDGACPTYAAGSLAAGSAGASTTWSAGLAGVVSTTGA